MKKTIIILLLSLVTVISFSQARLNSSSEAILKEFPELVYAYDAEYDVDYLYGDIGGSTVFYYFKDNACWSTVIVPDNDYVLTGLIERYDELYVRSSQTAWKFYTSYGVASIKLEFLETGGYMIVWKIIDTDPQ